MAARRRIERTDHIADRRARRFAIGADAKGVLRFQELDVEGDHVVLLVSERAGNDYLSHLQDAGVRMEWGARPSFVVAEGGVEIPGLACASCLHDRSGVGWPTRPSFWSGSHSFPN